MNSPLHPPSPSSLTRRGFLATTGAAAVSFGILNRDLALGAAANSKITIGVTGCGGRGRWLAKLFQRHGGYEVVAVHDYFADRANEAGEALGVPAAQRFTGLAGYQKLLDQAPDAVVIQTPPYFHPSQAAQAVAAGKHVYLAKPIAVDVPGCQSVGESGRKATAAKRCFLIDFQTRANAAYQEAIRKVHAGMIGKIGLAEATYHCGNTFDGANAALKQDPKNPELRLRAWGLDAILSGDVITEQNIHALDVASWILNAEPIKAYGTCAHTRGFAGTCHDTWGVVFHYPNDVILSFNAKQFGHGYDDILCRVYGTEGTIDTHYAGKVTVRSRDDAFNGNSPSLYEEGAVNNIATFHKAVTSGDDSNPTVEPSVRSNLVSILGRTAAYRKQEVTWKEVLAAKEKLEFDLKTLQG